MTETTKARKTEFQVDLDRYTSGLNSHALFHEMGKVVRVTGYLIEAIIPGAWLGSVCRIFPNSGTTSFLAEVVGFKERKVLMMPLGELQGVGMGAKVILERHAASIRVGPRILGRVLDGLGNPLDNLGKVVAQDEVQIYRESENPLTRPPISTPLDLGIKSINGMITAGMGQRLGIMAGSGVGKSVLLGMIARSTNADVNVIALIGERGRELREFVEKDLGPEGLARSVIICATSDQSPITRMRGAFVATAIAEYFCQAGKNVLLMMDSVTRFAMAQREVGLSIGEPPASKGYTPSVFALLPKLLERVGVFENKGSITGLYSVLVEGDDLEDPIADSVRSIVDGHIVLSRDLAQKGIFPAIDVLQSTSRLMRSVSDPDHLQVASEFRELLATYKEAEDLINIGAYAKGSNPKIDRAIDLRDQMLAFSKQEIGTKFSIPECISMMHQIVGSGVEV